MQGNGPAGALWVLPWMVIATCANAVDSRAAHAQAAPPGWVSSLCSLRPTSIELSDAKVPLERRVSLARALGRHGHAADAIALLRAGLDADPPLPGRLREALSLSLAERGVENGATSGSQDDAVALLALRMAHVRAPASVAKPSSGPQAATARSPVAGASIAKALRNARDAGALQGLLSQLQHEGVAQPEPAADALTHALCSSRAAPAALLALASRERVAPSESARRALRDGLAGRCSLRPARGPDDDPLWIEARVAAAIGLGLLRDLQAVPALAHALRSPFARVRLAAATALAALRSPKACAALARHARIEASAAVQQALACAGEVSS